MIGGIGFRVGQALPPANAPRGAGPRPANSRFVGAKKCREDSRHSRLDSLRDGLRWGIALLLPCAAMASSTTAWEMGSWSDFIRGRFQGISLSRDGRLSLAPKLENVFSSDQPVIWAVADAPDGTLYAATGNRGKVYRIGRDGAASLLWTADQPEVFALAIAPDGTLYAGTSPDGKVYCIRNGQATEYFAPHTRYIWSLAVAPDGALYVGTGDQGKVFRVASAGKGELYYDTGQSHVTGLVLDGQGRLLAGTEPNGLLYRISAKDKAFVLYNSSLPEIRALVPMPDGSVYAAALGGSVAKLAQAANQAAQSIGAGQPGTAVTTSITVEAQSSGPGGEIKPPAAAPPGQPPAPAPATPQTGTQVAPAIDLSNVEKSAIYRVNPDNTVETLWSSKEENVYDVLALGAQILFSTDVEGRVYSLAPDRRVTLIAQTNESQTTRLLRADHSILAATANMGRILRLGDTPGAEGEYEAPVHDAGTVARWGSLSWRAGLPAGCALEFRTRSGNSAKPDRTWSEWSAPLRDASGSRIASPNARYVQWKAELSGAASATPAIESVTLGYLPQNSPPVVRGINVVTQMAAVSSSAKPAASGAAAYSVTVTDSADASSAPAAGGAPQTLARAAQQQITVVWQADDPDGDRLVYSVYFRGADETEWKLLKADLHDNSITFDADALADGQYYFRVVASDREANPPASAREAQLVSAPVTIDNTPPTITVLSAARTGASAHIEWEAVDAASPLRRAEYSVDAASWVPMDAADGVIDSLRERFSLDLANLAPGEHVVALRAADSANNTGVAKVILK